MLPHRTDALDPPVREQKLAAATPLRPPFKQHGPLSYLLALPAARHAGPHPVLMFLHGYDEGPPTAIEDGVTRHGPLRPGNGLDLLDRFLIVAPQLPRRGDIWARCADDVEAIAGLVQREHGGDPARTYLTGFSFGGNGVFDLALMQPHTWAALWAVDPTRVPPRDPGLPVWLSFGEIARAGKEAFVRALQLRSVDHGDGDRIYLDEGADHVGSATLAYRDARIYSWLLSRRAVGPDGAP